MAKSDTQNGVTEARYERRGYRRGRIGRGVGVGIGLGILGGIVAAEAYRPRAGYYYDDEAYDGPTTPRPAMRAIRATCAPRISAPSSGIPGLYTTYGGDKRVCPYLR